jgi:hypothetical protein
MHVAFTLNNLSVVGVALTVQQIAQHSLTAENVNNLGGRIGGNDVSVAARQDLNNIGGSIGAVSSLSATVERDLNIQTTTQTSTTHAGIGNFTKTGVDRVAGLYVSGANGTLVASAGRDLNIVAGVVSNAGNRTTSLSAGNNFTLASVQTGEQNNITWDADNHLNYGNGTKLDGTSTGNGTYEYNPITGQQLHQDRGMNVVGYNKLGSLGSQGETLSRALNQVPTINATAGLHDYIFNANLLEHTTFNNIWTMPASAVVSIPAALNNPNISWITQVKQPDSVKPPTVPSVIRIDSNTVPTSATTTGGTQ